MKHLYDRLISIISDVKSDNAFEAMSSTLKERIYAILGETAELKNNNNVIPNVDSPVIFMVRGIKYYGYYSRDSFFYPRGNNGHIPFVIARHPKSKPPHGSYMHNIPVISSWEYA